MSAGNCSCPARRFRRSLPSSLGSGEAVSCFVLNNLLKILERRIPKFPVEIFFDRPLFLSSRTSGIDDDQ